MNIKTRVEIPERGLYDVLCDRLADAMKTTPDEVKTTLNI